MAHTRHCSNTTHDNNPLLERPRWGRGWETAVMKGGSDPELMRSWRWSGPGILVGVAECSNVGDGPLFLPPQERTALWGLCNQGSSGRGKPRGESSRELSGGPEVAQEGDTAPLRSKPASCPHQEEATPAFLQKVSKHSDQ